MFGRLLVAALAVVGVGLLLLRTTPRVTRDFEAPPVQKPPQIGRPAHPTYRPAIEYQLFGLDPASLILYTPPGFSPSLE